MCRGINYSCGLFDEECGAAASRSKILGKSITYLFRDIRLLAVKPYQSVDVTLEWSSQTLRR